MADQKISELNTITGANVDDASDKLAIVDASGDETKAITREELFKSVDGTTFHVDSTNNRVGVGTIAPSVELDVAGDAQVSGDFTVDTSTLHVDSTNNRVGIGTASPSDEFVLVGTARIGSESNNDMKLQGSVTPAVTVGGSANAAVISTFGTGAGSGHVGIEVTANDDNDGFYIATDANKDGTVDTLAVKIKANGNFGIGTTSPSEKLDVSGNVTISGSLSKGSGSFKIDHPLKPETHHLVHSFVEAPQADNIYRGRVDLVDGVATVNLDEAGRMTEGTFVLLNGNVQCFTSNETDWCPVRGYVNGNILTIEAQDNTCTDTISWLVIGERIDQHMIDTNWTDENGRIIVEPEKVIMEPEEEVVV